jgi:hypothetical protein
VGACVLPNEATGEECGTEFTPAVGESCGDGRFCLNLESGPACVTAAACLAVCTNGATCPTGMTCGQYEICEYS